MRAWVFVALLAVGCGDDQGSSMPDALASPDAASDAPVDAAEQPDGSPTMMDCEPTCTTANDCTNQTSGAFTPSNYSCDGTCHYTGCHDDQECQISYGSSGHTYRCVADATASMMVCTQVCAVAADCGTDAPSGSAYDGDNYSCDQNLCHYLGCNTDGECQVSFGASGGTFHCLNGQCIRGCTMPSDCTSDTTGAYAPDRYDCRQGLCVWLGCNSDQSCRDTYMEPGWTCR